MIQMSNSEVTFSHPKTTISRKAFLNLGRKQDNKVYLHHRSNLTLTLHCTNLGNPHNVPAMIPWDRISLHDKLWIRNMHLQRSDLWI